eukprot:364865-Chlamydomonas_euryale.AAC.8
MQDGGAARGRRGGEAAGGLEGMPRRSCAGHQGSGHAADRTAVLHTWPGVGARANISLCKPAMSRCHASCMHASIFTLSNRGVRPPEIHASVRERLRAYPPFMDASWACVMICVLAPHKARMHAAIAADRREHHRLASVH